MAMQVLRIQKVLIPAVVFYTDKSHSDISLLLPKEEFFISQSAELLAADLCQADGLKVTEFLVLYRCSRIKGFLVIFKSI